MDDLARKKLCQIVARYGLSATEARRCESLLKDYCGQLKREIFVLVCAVREQVVVDLLGAQESVPHELLLPLLSKRLQQNLALTEEAAHWAVESWALALAQLPLDAAAQTPGAETEQVDAASTRVANGASNSTPAPVGTNISQTSTSLKSASASVKSGASRPQPARLPASKSPTSFVSTGASSSERRVESRIFGRCEKPVRSISYAPDGLYLAACDDEGRVRLWDAASGALEFDEKVDGAASSVVFSFDGGLLAAASSDGGRSDSSSIVHVWELETGERHTLGECGRRAPVVAFSPDGTHLASGSADADAQLRVWNVETGQVRVYGGATGGLPCVAYAPDGLSIATGDGSASNAALRLWDLRTGEARVLGRCARQINSVAFAPGGETILTGSWDETVRLWRVSGGEETVLGKGCSYITGVAYAPRRGRVAACALDGKIRAWDLATGAAYTVGECQGVNAVAFSPDGQSLATGSFDGCIRLWSLR